MESPGGKSEVCFISGDYDCLNIGEIIKASGYDPESLLNRKLLITIEDEIQQANAADGEGRCALSNHCKIDESKCKNDKCYAARHR